MLSAERSASSPVKSPSPAPRGRGLSRRAGEANSKRRGTRHPNWGEAGASLRGRPSTPAASAQDDGRGELDGEKFARDSVVLRVVRLEARAGSSRIDRLRALRTLRLRMTDEERARSGSR